MPLSLSIGSDSWRAKERDRNVVILRRLYVVFSTLVENPVSRVEKAPKLQQAEQEQAARLKCLGRMRL